MDRIPVKKEKLGTEVNGDYQLDKLKQVKKDEEAKVEVEAKTAKMVKQEAKWLMSSDVEPKSSSEYSMAAPRQEPVSNLPKSLKPTTMTFGIPKQETA